MINMFLLFYFDTDKGKPKSQAAALASNTLTYTLSNGYVQAGETYRVKVRSVSPFRTSQWIEAEGTVTVTSSGKCALIYFRDVIFVILFSRRYFRASVFLRFFPLDIAK